MALKSLKSSSSEKRTYWYELTVNNSFQKFPMPDLVNGGHIEISSFINSGGTLPVTILLKDSSGATLKTITTVDADSGSTSGYTTIMTSAPVGTVQIDFPSITQNVAVSFSILNFPKINYLSVTKYTTSQSLTFTGATSFVLLGGGGAGGSAPASGNERTAGGGSGYLQGGSVAPGTYSLTIGAGGTAVMSGTYTGGTGGTTSLGAFSATGGLGGTRSDLGGAGGSGGGGRGGGNGGSNGSNGASGADGAGGAGSGVAANVFSPGTGGAGGYSGAGGGVYAGGGGGIHGQNNSGGSAATGTGGGGGGGGAQGSGAAAIVGGTGGTGAMWAISL
jgi:hypothetical protein